MRDSGVSSLPDSGSRARAKTGQWSVSTRSIGEVLTTEIRCDDLHLMLFAKPTVETARQIESRLEDLLSADVPDDDSTGTGSVPGPLERAVEVLLDVVLEVEQATGRHAGAIALYQSEREVACACIGGGGPRRRAPEQPFGAARGARVDGPD